MAFYPFSGGLTSALRGAGTAALVGVGTTGDAFNRAELDADGGLRFGTGAAAVDTTVSRNGVASVQVPSLTATGLAQLQAGAQVSNGFVDVSTIGKGLAVAEGVNAKQQTAVLVAGTVTVANTSITANSKLLLSRSTLGGTPGHLSYTTTAGVGYTINSSSATDTSTVVVEILEPG
ncbi:MAG TPA: hypothetical protein VGR98_21060 [Streptosporangiaceae bacterium]|nr:hypothetical protein [Streptosporangiaceae bacterium]